MDGLVRLWIVCAGEAPVAQAQAAGVKLARLFGERRPAAFYAASAQARSDGLRNLATALELEVRTLAQLDSPAALAGALGAIAREHDGLEVLCWLPVELVSAAIAQVFARAGDVGIPSLSARAFQLCGLDWPSGRDPRALPGLCGFDLDWLPPWRPGPPSRFPGGPGVAASGRG